MPFEIKILLVDCFFLLYTDGVLLSVKTAPRKKSKVAGGQDAPEFHHGVGPFNDVDLPGVWFFRIPHKVRYCHSCVSESVSTKTRNAGTPEQKTRNTRTPEKKTRNAGV